MKELIEKPGRLGRLVVRIRNFPHVHERWMANFLRKRNWIAFYLEPQSRMCIEDTCWMKLYLSELEHE